jgi:hypothetical protein
VVLYPEYYFSVDDKSRLHEENLWHVFLVMHIADL